MTEVLDTIFIVAIFFLPTTVAFVLVTFSPLRVLRQPLKLFVIGLASGIVAALGLSGLALTRGTVSSRAFLSIVAISILVGAVVSLVTSSEKISDKSRDELVRKSDDQSWRGP